MNNEEVLRRVQDAEGHLLSAQRMLSRDRLPVDFQILRNAATQAHQAARQLDELSGIVYAARRG